MNLSVLSSLHEIHYEEGNLQALSSPHFILIVVYNYYVLAEKASYPPERNNSTSTKCRN